MKNISVKRVELKDLEEIYLIELECFGGEAYSKSFLGRLLVRGDSLFLKALVDGEVAGFVVGVFRVVGGRRVCQLYSIDVRKRFRGMGVGSALLKAFEKRARELGAGEVVLQVEVSNSPALGLYLKHGYRVVRRIRDYYGGGRDAYEMVKKL